MNVLSRTDEITVLHHLIEGNTIRSTSRLTGVHKKTIAKIMVRFGAKCREFLDRELRDLTMDHIEVDEIWTFVGKKQARLTVEQKETANHIGDMYLWTCLDQKTKLLVTYAIGKRSADNARRLMMDLASRLRFPSVGSSDARNFQPGGFIAITQISTDGFAGYPEAVDLAFGAHAMYGQIIKNYRNANIVYQPSEMIGTERRGIFAIDESEEWSICTSHVERHNLTIRTLMKRFTRLSLGFSKKLENLAACTAIFMAYYNFCWRTRYPDWSGKRGRYRPTAAMMAGITNDVWTFDRLYEEAMR